MKSSLPLRERLADAVVLRPLSISDAAVAAGVIRAAFAVQPRPTCPLSSALRESAASIAEKIENGGGFGAWVDGRLAGLALWQVAGDSAPMSRACRSCRNGGARG